MNLHCISSNLIVTRVRIALRLLLWVAVSLVWMQAAMAAAPEQTSVVKQKTPSQWLQAMIEATQKTAYRGTFAFEQAGLPIASFEVVRGQFEGRPFERLRHLVEPAREMVRQNDAVTFKMHRGDDFVELVSRLTPIFFDHSFSKLFANVPKKYNVVFSGRKKIADRIALGVYVAPKDQHRFGYRLWLDMDSAFMLSFEMLDTEARNLESFIFKTIEIDTQVTDVDRNLAPEFDQISMRLPLQKQKQLLSPIGPGTEYKNWRFGWLPEGFALISRRSKKIITKGSTSSFHSLVYSDGLAVFSIFIEALLPNMKIDDQVSYQGGTITAVRSAKDRHNISHMVTVVGEIPEPTALQIARNIRYANAKPRPPQADDKSPILRHKNY